MDSSDWQSLPSGPPTNGAHRGWARWESKSATTEADLRRFAAPHDPSPRWLAPVMLSILLLVWRLSSCASDPASAPPVGDLHHAVVVDAPPAGHDGWR